MFKLMKNLPIQAWWSWIFRIQEGGFDKDGGRGLRPLSELCNLPILLTF